MIRLYYFVAICIKSKIEKYHCKKVEQHDVCMCAKVAELFDKGIVITYQGYIPIITFCFKM